MSVGECKSSNTGSKGVGGGNAAGKAAEATKAGAKAAQAGAKGTTAKSEIAKEMAEEKAAKVKDAAARVATPQDTVHTVKKGETLSGIAKANDVKLKDVVKANPQIKDPNLIHPGDQVKVPGAKAVDPTKPKPTPVTGDFPKYTPGSPEQVALFKEAAKLAGVPESWASSKSLQKLLSAESGGQVGVPNYTYGDRAKDPAEWGKIHEELRDGKITAKSSATGLGQLLAKNVDKYYPSGRLGIGNPVEEAAGMMSYIKDRYGSPENAWSQYNKHHEGY